MSAALTRRSLVNVHPQFVVAHNWLSLCFRHALRNLSRSTPTMNRLESQNSFEVSRSQRKFLRRFKDLDAHEMIIKCEQVHHELS